MRSFISIQLFLIASYVLLLNIDESVAPESVESVDGGFNAVDPRDDDAAPPAVVGPWKPDGKDSLVTTNEQAVYGRDLHARVASEGRVHGREKADDNVHDDGGILRVRAPPAVVGPRVERKPGGSVNARQPKQVEPIDDNDSILRVRDPTGRNEGPHHANPTEASKKREAATREARVPKAAPKPAKIAAVDPNANFLKKTAASEGKASVRAAGRKVPAKENADA